MSMIGPIRSLAKMSVGLLVMALAGALAMPAHAQTQGGGGTGTLPPDYDGTTTYYGSIQNPCARGGIGITPEAYGSWWFGSDGDPLYTKDDGIVYISKAGAFLSVEGWTEELQVGQGGYWLSLPTVDNAKQEGTFTWRSSVPGVPTGSPLDDIVVSFRYRLVRDVLRWEYTITNEGMRGKRIGLRVWQDVDHPELVGTIPNDFPYYLPGQPVYETEQEFVGGNVPNQWAIRYTPQGVDAGDLLDGRPLLKTVHSLSGPTNDPSAITKPERLVFAKQDEIFAYGWPYIELMKLVPGTLPLIVPGSSFYTGDANTSFAVGQLYSQDSVLAGMSRTISGEVKMNWSEVSANGNFALGVVAPEAVGFRPGDNPATPDIENGYYTPSAIDLRAYAFSASQLALPDVTVTINPGDGLRLADDQVQSYSIQRLPFLSDELCRRSPGDLMSWRLVPTGTQSGAIPVTVTATFNAGNGPKTCTSIVYINLPALPRRSFTSGIHFTGFPFRFADPRPANALNLGMFPFVAWWNPEKGDYDYAQEADVQLELGRGYWLGLENYTNVVLQGATPVDPSVPQQVSLTRGWNAISNPFQYAIEWGKCRVYWNDNDYTIDQARKQGIIRGELFSWDATENKYNLPGQSQGWSLLLPYTGYWVYCVQPVTLVFSPNPFLTPVNTGLRSGSPAVRVAPRADRWQANIVVEMGDTVDDLNSFGVGPDEMDGPSDGDVMEPPISPAGLSAYFPRRSWGRSSGLFAVDLQAPGTTKSWTFEVNAVKPNQTVVLRWPELGAELPEKLPLVLTDVATGKQIYMRTVPSYTFNSGIGGTRQFTISAGTSVDRLQFTQVKSAPSRGGAVSISYGLTRSAAVQVKMRTMTGHVVRTIQPSRSEAGITSVNWDGRDASGRPLARGFYLCELSAEADDGQRVRASLTVQVK